MENIQKTEKLINIIKDAHKNLSINVSCDEFCDNLVHVNIIDNETSGFGSDFDVHTAILKAYSEFFERKTIHTYNATIDHLDNQIKSSNGIAAHPIYEIAKTNSCNELIERDIFLTSWIANESPYWFRFDGISKQAKKYIDYLIEKFKQQDFEIRFGTVGTYDEIKCGILVIRSLKTDFGFAIDTCASSSWDEIISKLAISAYYYASVIQNRKRDNIKFTALIPEDIKKTSDILDYYLNPIHQLDILFHHNSKKHIINFPIIKMETKNIVTNLENPLNLHVVQTSSNDAQDFFIGSANNSNVNIYC